nr:glycosyl transferase group 2 family protein [Solirubrobacterales bacterium]
DALGWQPAPSRAIANGQCMALRRETLLAAGGWARVRGHMTEDVALARALRADGLALAFVDGCDLLGVRMYESARATWDGWGRSLIGPDVNSPLRLAEDLALLWLTMALPLPRLVARRGTPLDALLVAVRLALLGALARGYRPRGLPFWLSPLADVPTMVRLTWAALRPARAWRGRTYR